MPRGQSSASRVALGAIVAGAVLVRIAMRLVDGQDAFLTNGYTFNLTLAENLLRGAGLCYAPGESCALRLPVYPVFVAAFLASGTVYPGVVIAQALMGGVTAWLAWRIGRDLFDVRVGLAAAALTAANPYAVVHDTALQDTALVNMLAAAVVALLIRALRVDATRDWAAAGVVMAVLLLTSARLALFVPCALWLAAVTTRGPTTSRLRRLACLALPVALLAGGWMLRNAAVVGAPVLTTEGGEALYFGNGPLTFTHFPERSIDLTTDEFTRLDDPTIDAIEALQGHDVARDVLFRRAAIDYMVANPRDVVAGAVRKLWVVVSGELSPARGPLLQYGYQAVFVTVHLLALAGVWRSQPGRGHVVPGLFILAFALTTAVFWAHTSHKSAIDVLLFVYAAAGAFVLAPRQRGASRRRPFLSEFAPD